jgi:peptide deformylase
MQGLLMIQPLLIYPDDRINCTSTDVRTFNQTLWDIIEDMKDTMKEGNLEALAAIQIAYPYNIIIVKEDDEYTELINPRVLTQSGRFDSTESTSYYPNVEVTIPRDENIKLIYEDREGKVHHRDISDKKLAATIQRKIDYTFGGNILDKIEKKNRDKILEALEKSGHIALPAEDICPTFSKKDYFVSFTDKLLFFMGLSLFTPLFNFSKETTTNIYIYDKIAFPLVVILMVSFFFYAQYEAKKYKQCSSCQVGNNIGVIIKRVVVGVLLSIGSYFILSPN